MAATDKPDRPRLAFFQWNHEGNAGASQFLTLHMRDHVACLAQSFDVTVISEDCDLAEVCDRVEPDLVLFESGYRSHGSRRIEIRNTGANPDLRRLGFHNGDPWCDRRAGFLSDMDRWGVETFFSISTRMADYTPGIADRLFVWPNFINPATFHDYGQTKTIPVMLTGQAYGLYPWRQAIYPVLSAHYPCLITPPFSYESSGASRMLAGERYARALNASFVSPTCGTMGNEVVRKHFEIPGARCCMIAERMPALESAGFVDMHSCVFADAGDVLDKLDHLMRNPEQLAAITDAGHALVQSRHTLRHRTQILEWYQLDKARRPGERIVQETPFAPLRLATAPVATFAAGPALDRTLLALGRAALDTGRIDEAERQFQDCLALVSYLPEARLGLALCSLHRGDAVAAQERLAQLVAVTTGDFGAADPDPVEWATYIVALLCGGDLARARLSLRHYSQLRHPLLDHVARAIDRLDGLGQPVATDKAARISVHPWPDPGFEVWSDWLAKMLRVCGQPGLADRLGGGAAVPRRQARSPGLRVALYGRIDALLARADIAGLRPTVPPLPEFGYGTRLTKQALRLALPERLRLKLSQLRQTRRAAQARKAAAVRPATRP